MATAAVLRSPDYLARQAPIFPKQGRRSPNRTRSGGRRKRSPSDSESERRTGLVVKAAPAKELVMGEVRILKRGEDVMEPSRSDKKQVEKVVIEARSSEEDVPVARSARSEKKMKDIPDVSMTGRLGPEPESIPKEIRLKEVKEVKSVVEGVEKFAGSAFVASPSPSALPYPEFFVKKVAMTKEATKDLCRLLRLDIL